MKELSQEEIYKRNQKLSKGLAIASPFVFWGCLALALLCFYFAIKNSIGNIDEIVALLDTQKFTGEQLEQNYAMLVAKYGELVIGGASGGFQITFVNVGKAVFNGIAIVNAIATAFFVVVAYVMGKWLLPLFSKKIEQDNQDMVNLTILKNNK
jgi:hypothetical protein